ncbi:MAG: hypothetical protein WA869_20420, partial [Alloacidobacterium sp.]
RFHRSHRGLVTDGAGERCSSQPFFHQAHANASATHQGFAGPEMVSAVSLSITPVPKSPRPADGKS